MCGHALAVKEKKKKEMHKFLIFSLVLVLFSCTSHHKETPNSEKTRSVFNINQLEKDTLKDKNHYYYLADISPKEFAQLILKDSVIPSDNFSTFRVMDSLNAKSYNDRKFYFEVFLKIMKESDGALAEAVGLPAYDFVEKQTKEFFKLAQSITKAQFELWANNIAVEISLSSTNNPTKEAEIYCEKLRENCLPEQRKEVDRFCKIVSETIEEESN